MRADDGAGAFQTAWNEAALLIWSDLSSPRKSAGGSCRNGEAGRGKTEQVTARGASATVDHSNIRGSKPHSHDPSGAASD